MAWSVASQRWIAHRTRGTTTSAAMAATTQIAATRTNTGVKNVATSRTGTGATIQIATCAVHQRRQRGSTRSRGGRRPSPVCAVVMRLAPGLRGGRGSRLHPLYRHGRPETPRPGRAARPEGRLTQVAREAGLRNRLFDGEAARTVRRLGHEPGATLPSERGGPAPRRSAARARGGDGGLLPPGDRSRARAGRDRA